MTLHRPAGSIEAALIKSFRELSPEEIEAATGLKIATFRKASNPMAGGSLDLDDAAALDAALIAKGKPARFIEVMREITAAKLAELQGAEPASTDFARALVRLDVESGVLAKEIDDALADNHVDQDERRRIASAAQNVIDHARAIRDAAEPAHSSGSGSVTPLRPSPAAA